MEPSNSDNQKTKDTKNDNVDDDDMSPDERMAWLRERGVLVETPEERKAGQVRDALREAEALDPSNNTNLAYVLVPADTSQPLRELTVSCPSGWSEGDYLEKHLKPAFLAMGKDGKPPQVDLGLLQKQATQTLAGTGAPSVSNEALRQVAEQEGNVETFSLVHPTESNQFTGINIYLDEIGMLKRLPLNTRMMEYAQQAGYDPAPQFYGDVFLGRVRKMRGSGRTQNLSFCLGQDTDRQAPWLLAAATDNLEYQMEMNRITGRKDLQPSVDGANGVAKKESDFSWTQTEDELEVVVVLPTEATSKHIKVQFRPESLNVTCQGKETPTALRLFERIDVDGCTWTIDRSGDTPQLVVTMEKVESALWPRIQD